MTSARKVCRPSPGQTMTADGTHRTVATRHVVGERRSPRGASLRRRPAGMRPARPRAGTAGPRGRRHHPAGDAGRPARRPDLRRRPRPASTGAPRTSTPRTEAASAPGRAGPGGVLLVRPHLGQRLPRAVAAAAARSWSSTWRTGCARRAPAAAPAAGSGALRRPGAAARAQPHRAAHRRRLRGGARPGWPGSARASAGCAARHSPGSASSPRTRAAGGAQPGRRLALAAVVPAALVAPALVALAPDLERLRVPAPAGGHAPGSTRRRTRAWRCPASGTAAGSSPGCAPPTPPSGCSPSPPRCCCPRCAHDRHRQRAC